METLVKLDKELKKLKQTDEQASEAAVKDVKLLLAGDEAGDMNIMRYLAPNSEMIANETVLGRKIELEDLDKKYGNVFTIDQIKTLAVNYKLRLLPASRYLGKMDVQCIAKVKEFGKETLTSIDEHTLSTEFFILGPVEAFSTDKVSTSDENRRAREEARERRRAMLAADPILFYRIDAKHYRMIHKWGKDFTILRRFKGFKWASGSNHFAVNFLISLALTMSTLTYLRLAHIVTAGTSPVFWIIGSIISFVVAGFMAAATQWNLTDKGGKAHSDCFGNTNWNSSTLRVR